MCVGSSGLLIYTSNSNFIIFKDSSMWWNCACKLYTSYSIRVWWEPCSFPCLKLQELAHGWVTKSESSNIHFSFHRLDNWAQKQMTTREELIICFCEDFLISLPRFIYFFLVECLKQQCTSSDENPLKASRDFFYHLLKFPCQNLLGDMKLRTNMWEKK